jgi:hypothetical protein
MVQCQEFFLCEFRDEHNLLLLNKKAFDPVSIIAILIFSFTFIHPLPDGNGRTHRLLIHFLLEKFSLLDSWLVPVSIIILHDNLRTGASDRVFRGIQDPLLRRCRYYFDDTGGIVIDNATRIFYECWDATEAVEYFYILLEKASRISVDCGLYINIWDSCLSRLVELGVNMSHSNVRMVINRYLETGIVSKNTQKKLSKSNVPECAIMAIADICAAQLRDDPLAFKVPFEPFNMADKGERERAYEPPTVVEEGFEFEAGA